MRRCIDVVHSFPQEGTMQSPSTSRNRSPSPTTLRCRSPPSRAVLMASESAPKRSISAERRRPSAPPSPPTPLYTPVKDSYVDIYMSSGKVLGGRLPDGLWPSTMRRLSVSLQSDWNYVPPSKKEKPVASALSERPLRSSSNVHKQVEAFSTVARKPISEKKRSPLVGKNVSNQSENSKPVDSTSSRLIDQHRWPSRTGAKVSSISLTRSVDLIDMMARSSLPPVSSRRMSLDAARLPSADDRVKVGLRSIDDKKHVPESSLYKVTSKSPLVRSRPSSPSNASVSSPSISRCVSPSPTRQSSNTRGISPTPGRQSAPARQSSPTPARHSTSTRGISPTPARQSTSKRGISPSPEIPSYPSRGTSPTPARQSISTRGVSPSPEIPSYPSRGTSPTPARQSISTRGVSLVQTKPSSPRVTSPTPARRSTPARGASPTPTRPSAPARDASPTPSTSHSSASVLSFIADLKNGKKNASNIDDAHQLRLVYNRCLQWQFANARAGAVFRTKKVIAEKILCNVWNGTLALCETVTLKRMRLQQLRLEHKLNSVLKGQLAFLDDWGLLERDHIICLSGAIEDFTAGTLHLPITRGARVDTESLRLAVCSAVDVMQTMGFSICSLLSRVESVNSLVSQLAFVALQESELLDQCEALLDSTAAVQVEECSLRTHFIQMRQAFDNKCM